jgi:hypothetical protein
MCGPQLYSVIENLVLMCWKILLLIFYRLGFALHCELLITVVHCLWAHFADLIFGVCFLFLSMFWVLGGV